MKETLHSSHHSIVFPRLGASRKESLHNLHTRGRFGYSAPRQQQSTEGAPTPNSGRGAENETEATKHSLTATIRTLPSTAGLQAYGFVEPPDSCTDYGASPQDVRHLFSCNAHPTDFSHEDLWQIRWDRFVR